MLFQFRIFDFDKAFCIEPKFLTQNLFQLNKKEKYFFNANDLNFLLQFNNSIQSIAIDFLNNEIKISIPEIDKVYNPVLISFSDKKEKTEKKDKFLTFFKELSKQDFLNLHYLDIKKLDFNIEIHTFR